jgi:hypothetical protein
MSSPIIRLPPSTLAKAGKISPPWQGPGFDRPAAYTLRNQYFDCLGRLIEPGVPLDPDAEEMEPEVANPGNVGEDYVPLHTLIAMAETMPMVELRVAAERALGADNLHRTRQQIINQLRRAKNTGGHIDWEDWERGGNKVSLVRVKNFIAQRFGKVVSSRRQALALLRENGILGLPPGKLPATSASRPSLANAAEGSETIDYPDA